MKTYLFSYRHDGAEWAVEIQAASEADAKARVAKLAYASYDGELVAKVPASLGFIPRLLVSVRNTLSQFAARA